MKTLVRTEERPGDGRRTDSQAAHGTSGGGIHVDWNVVEGGQLTLTLFVPRVFIFPMNKTLLAWMSVCALAVSASAQTMYDWTLDTVLPGYTGAPPFPDGQIGDGSGQLIRNAQGRVYSMTGTVGGNAVSLLPIGTVVAGLTLNNTGPNPAGGNLGFLVNGENVVLYYPSGGPFKWASTSYGPGNMTFLQNNPTPVPEPETWAMGVVFGAAGLVTVGIRRRRAAQGQA